MTGKRSWTMNSTQTDPMEASGNAHDATYLKILTEKDKPKIIGKAKK